VTLREHMRFTKDDANDVVEAAFDLTLKTPEDADEWARCVSTMLLSYGQKVWLLIDLSGLKVRPTASAAFGKRRAEVLEKFAHASVRFGGDPWTVVSINTSAALHHTHGNVFSTRDEALRFLLSLRDQLHDELALAKTALATPRPDR
jgi:hypothetical protein